MVLAKVPGWVVDEESSIRSEIESLRGATLAERWAATRLCASDAVWAARLAPDPRKVFDFEDPLPATTVIALDRLRALYGRARDRT